jgi:hypothetical protein
MAMMYSMCSMADVMFNKYNESVGVKYVGKIDGENAYKLK